MFADYVCLKINTVQEQTWKLLNRPDRRLHFDLVRKGIEVFARSSGGVLSTESVLFKDMNDTPEEVRGLTTYLARLHERFTFFTSVEESVADALIDSIPGARVISSPMVSEFIAAMDRVTQTPPIQ